MQTTVPLTSTSVPRGVRKNGSFQMKISLKPDGGQCPLSMETSPALHMARDPTRHLHAKSLSSKWGTNSSAPPSPLLGEGRDEGEVRTTDHNPPRRLTLPSR